MDMPLVGKKIGPYSVLAEIGSGGMAVIYKAEQPALDRLVAIKEARAELTRDKQLVQRFEREAKCVAGLAHHNIVHIYDFISRGNSMYIVMEYVEGVDLYNLMNRVDRIPPNIAAIIALQAARALEYAHFHGVVHRDFKPSNLMLTKQGEVKLMDFGIARDASWNDLTRPGTALGTPSYMSPEQIMGQRVDHRSDLFSFGIVLYQMLTGQKPFKEDDTMSVMQRILTEPYVRPRRLYPDVPWTLQRIVQRCLHKSPDKRYRDTERLRRDLESFVARKVRINYSGRLVVYMRNRELVTDNEAKTYVREEELQASRSIRVDSGQISIGAVVLRPLLTLYFALLVCLAGWAGYVKWAGLGEERGYVHVHANPWADVYVNGELFDTTPFARAVPLLPGKHNIEFRNSYFQTQKRVVEVVAGETKRLHVRLQKRRR